MGRSRCLERRLALSSGAACWLTPGGDLRDTVSRALERALLGGSHVAYDVAEPMLTPKQAARYLSVGESTLRLWRTTDCGPRYSRAGTKLIRYRRADLDAWIDSTLTGVSGAEPAA